MEHGFAALLGRRGFPLVVISVMLVAAACTGGGPSRSTGGAESSRGGTLRVGMINDENCAFPFCGPEVFDPAMNGFQPPVFEVFRCCLIRTLLSFNGLPTGRGGAVPKPDVAAGLPTVSEDGLTWTFHLRPGLRYAPPLVETRIVARDFIRGIERLFSPRPNFIPDPWGQFLGGYSGGFLDLVDIISGARDYADGKATSISGLEAPNDTTLVVRLTRPTGDLGYRLAQPDFGPIPPNPSEPNAKLGVAEGLARFYGSFVVATGPYMVEGADKLDVSRRIDPRSPLLGDRADSFTLVRNPSWDPKTDGLREALPDRIVLRRVDDERQAHELVDSGVLDLVLNWEAPPDVVAQAGSERGFTTAADHVKFVTLNLAVPPLDDLHVRRAINFAVARGPLVAGLRQAGVGAAGATHTGLDSEENNLLLAYDPYDASTGDAKKAAAEMANSRYDDNHDGRCDASACETLRLVVLDRAADPVALDLARRFARDVAHIGLQVQVIPQDRDAYGSTYAHPEARIPMRLTDWYKDLTSGSTFFPPLFGSPKTGVTQANGESVLGASSRELRRWGYRITSVPSVDDRITRCLELFFESQLQCWADLDQHLTTEVVPVVPLVSLTTAKITSSRVHSLTFGPAASTPQPSLDRIGLGPQEPVPRSTARPAPVPGIPGAVYRFTITKEDLFRFDRTFDPESVDENTGEVTMFIGNGQWRYIQIADHPIYHPLSAGVYSGSGNRVVFETLAPPPNALKTPPMRWTFRGDSLRFKFLGCGNLNDLDPTAPRLCDDYRTFFEAHPWEKIG